MKPSPQNVIGQLASIARELEKLALPAGRDGSEILDGLEAIDRARMKKRTAAKAMLMTDPDLLVGWRIALPNGRRSPNPGPRWKEGQMLVSEYRRATSIRLIKRRPPESLRKGGKPA